MLKSTALLVSSTRHIPSPRPNSAQGAEIEVGRLGVLCGWHFIGGHGVGEKMDATADGALNPGIWNSVAKYDLEGQYGFPQKI
jgi:hypothetical protein